MYTNTSEQQEVKDVYEIINERIIDQLTSGNVPWLKSWAKAGLPTNLVSKRPYRGINVMLLACLGYERNLFLTSKQLNEMGASIKPYERPNLVAFWSFEEIDDNLSLEQSKPPKKTGTLRYYTVFNIAQCQGIADEYLSPVEEQSLDTVALCEKVLNETPLCPVIKHKEQFSFYDPLRDYINMPKEDKYSSKEEYYFELFHQIIHSTGHRNRLNRNGLLEMPEFASNPYSHEELVAIMGSAYLQSYCNLEVKSDADGNYISSWIDTLKKDKRLIFSAASAAQKAIDYILHIQPDNK